jgi:hypothetical protein
MKGVLSFVFISVLLGSCTTYLIPVESFNEQFSGMKESEMKEVVVKGPVGEQTTYKTFPQDSVDCIDKNGRRVRLEKAPSLEIRFTDSNNKKTTFYFDRIFVTNSSVKGTYSRILSLDKTISLSNIKKIELQDGRKNYRYVH